MLHGDRAFTRDIATLIGGRVRHRVLTHHGNGRRLAPADARRVQHANILCRAVAAARRAASCDPASSQAIESQTRTVIAGGAVVALLHHVEVVIERRHLVDLGHRHLHLSREGDEMRGRQTPVAVLNLVQVLDQQVAAAGLVAQQRPHVFPRLGIDARPLGFPRTRERFPRTACLLTSQSGG